MKVYLIGMPGSGKSTLGRQLAAKLSLNFVDLDHEIEKRALRSVPEIFAEKGEDYFRKLEAETLREFAANSESFVMATGGGAPCFYNGLETLNSTGVSIFLDVPVDELVRRLTNKKDRPLLQNEDPGELKRKLEALKEKRYPVYGSASIVVRNPDLSTVLSRLTLRK